MSESRPFDSECIVRADRVSKAYRDFWGRRGVVALEDFSLELHRGEISGLVGRNGSGKSTALRCLLGLARPSSGEVLLLGKNPRHREVRAQVGYVPEASDLNPHLTPAETLHFHGRLLGMSRSERRTRIAELVGRLDLHANANRLLLRLSHGTVRRASLAVALLNRPAILVLDEPLSGVDPEGVVRIRELLEEARKAGSAILLSSHILATLPDLVQTLTLLHGGKVRAKGEVATLLEDPERWLLEVRGLAGADFEALVEAAARAGARTVRSGPSRQSLEEFYLRAVGAVSPTEDAVAPSQDQEQGS